MEKAKEEAETRQEIVGVRKSIRVKVAEKTEEETQKSGTRPEIGDARKERRIAAVEKAKEEAETRQEIVGVRKSKRVKIAEKTEKETQKSGTPPAIGGMKKGGRIATAAKEANSRPANTAERKGHQVAAAVTERKGHHAAAEQGVQTPPAIIGMRKESGVTAAGKEIENPLLNAKIPTKVPLIRAATPHENAALPARKVGFESDMQHSG